MKKTTFLIVFLSVTNLIAQIDSLHYAKGVFAVQDSIVYHPVSTNPYYFKIKIDKQKLDSIHYRVDFAKSILYLKSSFFKKYPNAIDLQIDYYKYPDFLTKEYQEYDPAIIVENSDNSYRISLDRKKKKLRGKPLEGLDTQGNIIRGITIGNNQDAVLNSVLDLKIEGKLSSKVTLRARINDTNIPIQESGYSQDLKDLDRVYIEMEGPNWRIKAGDVFLKDSTSYFMHFNKKVAGVSVETHTDKWHTSVSGALVKGRFTSHEFQGQEANQGPYKLTGSNGEAYIFIINASEKVFINGILQKGGIDKDYIIDYQTGEITFTATKPITSDMRIQVEYQYSDRNYSRFVTHETVTYKSKKLQMGVSYFNESDLKNQPLQINLTDYQKELLAQAGNNSEQLFVTQAVETKFIENTILYRLVTESGDDVYQYSDNSDDTLYRVGFTYVGAHQGDYQVLEYLAIGKKMEFVGENNGDYIAKIPLVAPSRQQITMLQSQYKPNDKTAIAVEMAYAENDLNLFSTRDNHNNKAPAIKTSWNQVYTDSTKTSWLIASQVDFFFQKENFKSIERLHSIEFNRDWNLNTKEGDQRLFLSNLKFIKPEKGQFFYSFENLNFTKTYKGNKQTLGANYTLSNFKIKHQSSYLSSNGSIENTGFARTHTKLLYAKENWWASTKFDLEDNEQRDKKTDTINYKSYKFMDVEALIGVGDSAKIHIELGAQYHTNDSLVDAKIQRVNNSKTWFVNSQLIRTKEAQLKIYANYRMLTYRNQTNSKAINSSLIYSQQLFNQFVILNTQYQNTAGNIPQHEYTYVETQQGHGFYTWIDYNGDAVQDLDEFEVAKYADQANYLRVALPNITYLPTNEVRLQQSIKINFSKWKQKKGLKKLLSHWSNDFSILSENNQFREGSLISINPFDFTTSNLVSNQFVLRNSLLFNRGLANFTTIYNYSKSQQRVLQTFGNQENEIELNQLLFKHRIQENWQLGFTLEQSITSTKSEAFFNRNYHILGQSLAPNLSYFFNKSHWIKTSYSYAKKDNRIGELESLKQQKLAINYQLVSKEKTSFSVEVKVIKNQFTGLSFSAVGYMMLEGLQPDNNVTWSLLWSHKLNSFLYLNLNYNGRANSFSNTIHNGNVQLRASF